MTLLKKAALSLVLAVLLFAGFAAVLYTGLFGIIEARFYNPSVNRAALREAERDRVVIQDYFDRLESNFAGFVGEPALRRSFLPNAVKDDLLERERLSVLLAERLEGLRSVRFIDGDGFRIHFSTRKEDLLAEGNPPEYRNYEDDFGDMPYEALAVSVKGESRLILDGRGNRVICSYPFFDAMNVYRGTAVFTLSPASLTGALLDSGRLKIGEDAVIVGDPPGVILGGPRPGMDAAVYRAAEIWRQDGNYPRDGTLSRIDPDGGEPLVLASSQTAAGVFTGRLLSERHFVFSPAMKAVLLLSFFLTSFLTIFLLFNARADPMAILHIRLRVIRSAVLKECRSRRNSALPLRGWELEQRREALSREIKRTLKIMPEGDGSAAGGGDGGKTSRRVERRRRLEREIDASINAAWNEIEALADYIAASRGNKADRRPERPREKAEPAAALPRPARHGAQAVYGRQNRAAELEPVNMRMALLSRPLVFAPELNGKPEPLSAFPASAGEPVFKNKDGITCISKTYLAPGQKAAEKMELDERFKNLVDSVINGG